MLYDPPPFERIDCKANVYWLRERCRASWRISRGPTPVTVCWRQTSASQHGVLRRPQQVVCALSRYMRLDSLKKGEVIVIWF